MARWPRQTAFFWQQAPFFRLLPPLIAAILVYDRWPVPAGYSAVAGCLGGGFLFFLIALRRKQRLWMQVLSFTALQLCCYCFGWWLAARQDVRRQADWLGYRQDSAALHLVEIASPPVAKARTLQLPVRLLRELSGCGSRHVSGNALLYIYRAGGTLSYAAGDRLLVPARWQPIRNAGNPFEFDYEAFCRRRQVFHQLFVPPEAVQLYAAGRKERPSVVQRLHHYCAAQLNRYFTDSSAGGLLQAMLLGDEHGFDPALRQAYADTGVIHIVSISGSHVAMLFLVVTALLWWLKGAAGKWIRYGVGLVFVWLYVLMAGAPPSAVRAAVMFSIVAVSITVSRQAQPLNTLLAAAFLLLCLRPEWLFAVGFQLSFCAVLSLMLFYRPVYGLLSPRGRLLRWLWQSVAASIAAEVLTAPLGIRYFHNFPLLFIPANILATVLLGLLALVGGMAVIALSWWPQAAQVIAWAVSWCIQLFNRTILLLQALNPVSFRYLRLSDAGLPLLYLMIGGLGWALLKRRKPGMYLALVSGTVLLAILCLDKWHMLRQERLVVYQAGREFHSERIHGPYYQVLCLGDTVREESYVSRQAHTGWQAWRQDRRPLPDCFRCRGQTVLQLKEGMATGGRFPVDVLIVARPLKGLSPAGVQAAFHPRVIVLGGRPSARLLQRWTDSCHMLRQPLHAVSRDGAFVGP